ncbi:hypothetical protein H0A36_14155 [Endozoicomonas sp. SM1973]|uniref:DUF7079 domain-containing protein n=1 Tax=Spartinivicinus marinus TaxID=2994442 RepID=A0A853HZL5_9GAMM|nr:hypothetical protein [Spartinivicinus marinus]MCX4028492.1 hypothetical protein [Spartinivicinus marinus]NYZ67160.1 hypothetical protein [Spartinivicinus marinus]
MQNNQLEQNKIVWSIISELFLDNQLRDLDLNHIAKELLKTSFTEKELNEIFYYDVAPICFMNLQNVAGEWEGFDKEWLFSEIQKNRNKNQIIFRLKCKLLRSLYGSLALDQWAKVLEKLRELRDTG